MNNILILQLNKTEKLVIEFIDSLDELHCCYDSKITFVSGSVSEILATDSARYLLDILNYLLKEALLHKLKLHESIAQDVGYLWNEYMQDKPGLTYKKNDEGYDRWVGEDYLLWGNTWIYNNAEGDIIFEITPHYKWHFGDPNPDEEFVSYEQWIKDYKPLIIRKIPHEVATEWVKQIDVILKKIEENNKLVFGNKK